MPKDVILAIDEGTTNSKAVLIDRNGSVVARGSHPVATAHPRPGWVEQDAGEIWSSTVAAIAACVAEAPSAPIAAIGISNQRESILIWDRQTGLALGPVITWQCRRTADTCEQLKSEGHEPSVLARTGLPLDPLFPATKIAWLLHRHCADTDPARLCAGTVDAWLIWNLTGQQVHATDASNASRTQLFNVETGRWDDSLCALFDVPDHILPQVRDSATVFGQTRAVAGLPDGLPIASAIGDSHGALFGHGAFSEGDGKVTFGTGSSVMTTVPEFRVPPKGVTTTIAWSLNGHTTYAFEGNILVSASILPWTAELLGLADVDALLELAQSVTDSGGTVLIPAHVGLGSPHWNSSARGLIDGLTFGSGPAHIAHAAAQSIALQVCDVFAIVESNSPTGVGNLYVDGGPSRNAFLMQMVADYLQHPVITRDSTEASALGAAFLAGIATGFWTDANEIATLPRQGLRVEPQLDQDRRTGIRENWRKALARALA